MWDTSTGLPGAGNINYSREWKITFFPRDAVHRAARKVTVLISLVQDCGTADNCLVWGSPSSTVRCCRRKVKEGDQILGDQTVSSNDS